MALHLIASTVSFVLRGRAREGRLLRLRELDLDIHRGVRRPRSSVRGPGLGLSRVVHCALRGGGRVRVVHRNHNRLAPAVAALRVDFALLPQHVSRAILRRRSLKT